MRCIGQSLVVALAFSAVSTAVTHAASPGQLDPSFGLHGQVTVPLVTSVAHGGLAVQPDGRLLLAGPSDGFGAVRLTRSGQPDASFGSGGVVRLASPAGARATVVAVDPQGRILMAGPLGKKFSDGVLVARVGTDGRPDLTFGRGGEVMLSPPPGGSGSHRQPDSPVTLVRVAVEASTGGPALLTDTGALIRLDGSGAVRGGRTADGWTSLLSTSPSPHYNTETFAADLVSLPQGHLAVLQHTNTTDSGLKCGSGASRVIAIDTPGNVNADFAPTLPFSDFAAVKQLLVDRDGQLVIPGGEGMCEDSNGLPSHSVLGRLLPDGRTDRGFGVGGSVNEPDIADFAPYLAAQDTTGAYLAAGKDSLARIDAHGKPDLSFGDCGVSSPRFYGDPKAMVVQPQGPLVVAEDADNQKGTLLVAVTLNGQRNPHVRADLLSFERLGTNELLDGLTPARLLRHKMVGQLISTQDATVRIQIVVKGHRSTLTLAQGTARLSGCRPTKIRLHVTAAGATRVRALNHSGHAISVTEVFRLTNRHGRRVTTDTIDFGN